MRAGRVPPVTIRRASPADPTGVADVLLAAWRATYEFPGTHSDADVRAWVADTLLPQTESWVAVDESGTVVAMMSLSETMLDQLYVTPGWVGRGLGSRLVALAKERRPRGLDLYTFQVNARARRF